MDLVLVVGTGLIGGSVGMGLRAAGAATVRGVDRSPEHLDRALELGAVDEISADLAQACEGADLAVVAVPVGQVVPTVERIASAAPRMIVTDVGSAKGPIVAGAEAVLGSFVGGHPMAGSEREGIEAARADLFEGALWMLTPTAHTDAGAFRKVNTLVQRLGARSLALDPAEHDRLVALVSHLPYAVATTLMELAGSQGDDRVLRAAAGSFRDVTRTAGSNPGIWKDILSANRGAVLGALDAFTERLSGFRDALAADDWDAVTHFIEHARDARRRLPLKGERGPADPFVVQVPIPDRAGVLAEITTSLGAHGVNIEDLWMEHSAAGGIVRIVVDGPDVATSAAKHLRELDYRVAVMRLEE